MDKITLMEMENSLADSTIDLGRKKKVPENFQVVQLKLSSLKGREKMEKMNRTRKHTNICIMEVEEERRGEKGQTIYNI